MAPRASDGAYDFYRSLACLDEIAADAEALAAYSDDVTLLESYMLYFLARALLRRRAALPDSPLPFSLRRELLEVPSHA